jgi:hypothetical protein
MGVALRLTDIHLPDWITKAHVVRLTRCTLTVSQTFKRDVYIILRIPPSSAHSRESTSSPSATPGGGQAGSLALTERVSIA